MRAASSASTPAPIEAIEVWVLELGLVEPLTSARAEEARRPVVLVRVLTGAGEGWGECVALAAPAYSEEYAEGAVAVLLEHLGPAVLAASAARPGEAPVAALAAMAQVRGHRMAKAAIEMAVLDAQLCTEGRSLAAFLGAGAASVVAGATIGLAGDVAESLASAERAVGAGYRRLKCKLSPGRGLEAVVALRREAPEVAVAVDANGSFRLENPDDRAALAALDGLGLVAIEQPLDPDDLAGHARLAAELDTPVLLDESIRSPGALEAAAALSACDGVCVKPGPLGGVVAARAVHDRAVDLGLSLAMGGMLETGLARAASLAVAALPGFDLPGDLGASDRYFAPDLTEPHVLTPSGELAVPAGPGVGRRPWPDGPLGGARLAGSLAARR